MFDFRVFFLVGCRFIVYRFGIGSFYFLFVFYIVVLDLK